MARKTVRVVVTLECTESHTRTYVTTKNRRNDPGRLELMKYCPECKRHTLHRETK